VTGNLRRILLLRYRRDGANRCASRRPAPPLCSSPAQRAHYPPDEREKAAERVGAELRSHDDPMLDQIPTGVTNHSKARTDGVSSSDMLGRRNLIREVNGMAA
jgi:hypothetical protein